jgi:N-acetylmuramoyl-L-alanine amidase
MRLVGKCSSFGGPTDMGVLPSEDLAFWESWDDVVADHAEELFLPSQPPGTSGLARRLDGSKFYLATRWNYEVYSKASLASGDHVALVRAENGRQALARPSDWGPNEDTGRVCDLSPGLMTELGLTTDDVVTVVYPFGEQENDVAIHRVAISAGHGKSIPGASGILDEAEETPKVMMKVAEELRRRGVTTVTFWDQTSTNVSDNLDEIVDWHDEQTRDLDVSCHFNSSNGEGHGVEVLYLTQEQLAAKVSAAIAINGLTDRGAIFRDDLAFLNGTDKPAILIETCFLDNRGDVDIYQSRFDDICASIAAAIAGTAGIERPERPPRPSRPEPRPVVSIAIEVPANVELEITVNGEELLI